MDYDVVEARYVGGRAVWLRFRDGTAREIDLSSELYGPVFEPLRDPAVFSRFQDWASIRDSRTLEIGTPAQSATSAGRNFECLARLVHRPVSSL